MKGLPYSTHRCGHTAEVDHQDNGGPSRVEFHELLRTTQVPAHRSWETAPPRAAVCGETKNSQPARQGSEALQVILVIAPLLKRSFVSLHVRVAVAMESNGKQAKTRRHCDSCQHAGLETAGGGCRCGRSSALLLHVGAKYRYSSSSSHHIATCTSQPATAAAAISQPRLSLKQAKLATARHDWLAGSGCHTHGVLEPSYGTSEACMSTCR